tara:strand:+ start:1176 stop:3725 length:2550 start_codon:yes stop_codon:yes gene_type:complete
MARSKIDYGIDLGTTNSAIARMENSESVIKKSEGLQKDTTPSCVHFNKKKATIVGDKALDIFSKEKLLVNRKNDPTLLNSYVEFKRTMGTDEKFECKNMGKSFSSEELSSEVLKALTSYVRDEEINSIVVTVPAKFQGYQKDATKKAAKMSGFQHCILLQEPIAASIAYGIDAQTVNGQWLVFDFGGGTFDVALMKANEGIMKVVDTEGDNHLGGKNLDLHIVDEIIIPYLEENYTIHNILENDKSKSSLRNTVKSMAEDAKINLSPNDKNKYDILTDEPLGEDDEGNEIEIDLSVTKAKYDEVVTPIFQRAIDLTKKLLKNNNLTGTELTTIIMIGGPTFSHTLREMVRKQITNSVDVSIDPMIAVARGAALFASTIDIPEGIKKIDKSKIQLKLSYQADTAETEEQVGIRVLRDKTDGEIPELLFAELNRTDKGWNSGKVELKEDAEILDIHLEPGKSNGFEVIITDKKGTNFPCEPESISIIQGFKVANATLPFDVCIEAYGITVGKELLTGLKGLKKNQPLPAKGSRTYQTSEDVRPGKKNDIISIPVYYGEENSKGIYNDLRGEVVITGDQLQGMLPKGSDIELIIEIDESESIKVTATFPYLEDQIIDRVLKTKNRKTVTKKYLEKELKKSNRLLENLEEEYPELDLLRVEDIRNGLIELEDLLEKGGSEADTRDEIFNRMREHLKGIDELESTGEWPKVMQELTNEVKDLEKTDEQYGDDRSAQIVQQVNDQVKSVIEKQDLKMAKGLTEQIKRLNWIILNEGAGVAVEISYIKGFDDEFNTHEWSDRSKARQLINEAKNIISSNHPTKENLRPIMIELFQLLPKATEKIGEGPSGGGLVTG